MIVLLNDQASRGQQALAESFRARGLDPAIRAVGAGEDITSLARQAVLDGEETVVAAGGDGTIGAVASALAGTGATLGVLPLGTLNHFAQDLGIPLELEAAVDTLSKGRVVTIDAAEVNGRLFINNSSLGLYPAIVFDRERRRGRGWNKWLAMVWASLSVFHRFPALNLDLEAGGHGARLTTPFVFIGNNEYQLEGFNLGQRRSLDSGYLWVFVAPHRSSRWGLVRLTLQALFKRASMPAFATRELWIETARPRVRAALDGEVMLLDAPLHYRSRPRALRVRVPAESG